MGNDDGGNGFELSSGAVMMLMVGICCIGGQFMDDSDSTGSDDTSTSESTSSEPENTGPGKVEAWVACKDFVKRRLKAPSSAEFPWIDTDDKVTCTDDTCTVTAWVDAQNSFGANLRKDFVCKIEKSPDSWTLKDLNLL